MPTVVPTTVVIDDDDQRDHQRNARADDAAREHVAAELVGAEEVDRLAVDRAEEMDVGRDEPEEPVAVALDEEAEIDADCRSPGPVSGWKVTGSSSPVSTIG